MADLGYAQGYKYAHDYPRHIVDQEYLPEEIRGTIYFEPSSNGYEGRIKEWIDQRRAHKTAKDQQRR